jgi:hypothetical protein
MRRAHIRRVGMGCGEAGDVFPVKCVIAGEASAAHRGKAIQIAAPRVGPLPFALAKEGQSFNCRISVCAGNAYLSGDRLWKE